MVARREQYVTDVKGRRVAVILPFRDYQRVLEDLHDLAVVAERRDEDVLTFEELKHRLD